MSHLTLIRVAHFPFGTFGYIDVGGQRFWTAERPWRDNRPFESCIPPGDYECVLHPTTTSVPADYDGNTWYLIGGTVGLDEGDRTRIAIHAANRPKQLNGCIALGFKMGCVPLRSDDDEDPILGITHSMHALREFAKLVPDYFNLSIVGTLSHEMEE